MNFENLPSTNTPLNANNLNQTINLSGFIQMYAGNVAPTGWLICDGSAISRATYADLFAVIGTTYGTGDGSTTFNLPDLRGRVGIGLKSTDTDFDTLGETGGEKKHTLTVNEMPSHKHKADGSTPAITYYHAETSGDGFVVTTGTSSTPRYLIKNMDNTGGDRAHNILQPYIIINYIIKT